MTHLPYANLPPNRVPSYAQVPGKVARQAVERPSRLGVLLVVAMFLLPVSLVPASRGELIYLPPFPTAWWTIYLMMGFGLAATTFRLLAYNRRLNRRTVSVFLLPFLLLGLWQMLSLFWNEQDNLIRKYSLLQALSMCAAVTAAVMLTSGMSFVRRMQIAGGLSVLVGGIVFVYAGLSFLFPSLRPSHAFMDRTSDTLGFIRVFGPLGKPTTLNFIMLPALGVSIGMMFLRGPMKLFWLLLSMFFLMCILGTGSRGGVLCLGTFGMLMLLFAGHRALFVLIPAAIALLALVATVGVPERFRSFEDNARVSTYETGWHAYTRDPGTVVLGRGHGALYTKLHDDTMRKMLGEDRWYLLDHRTEYG